MQYAGALRIAGMADSVVTHEPYLAKHRHDYGPTVLYRTLAGQFVLARDYSKALKVQRLIKEDYARVLQEVDFLVTPAAP
jgi:Asp-tRNA(Asn)/Glu-tRNA(Gln) amidotransferase A subunit family amidase